MEPPPVLNPRTHSLDAVKAEIAGHLDSALDELFDVAATADTTVRDLETGLWRFVVSFGKLLLSYLLARRCLASSQRAMEAADLTSKDVRFRMDKDYWCQLQTTFGLMMFPLFAFRHDSGLGMVTRVAARDVVPLRGKTRSSELCLEWEIRLGSDHPFRIAQEELTYFTHGATKVEDNAIATHMIAASSLVDRHWLYRTAAEVKDILANRAIRDLVTNMPLVYMSCDAHAERRYVDETWDAAWKMANGIRLWCIDKDTGKVIHLGGEYTWGDCRQVGQAFKWLVDQGIVPNDGDYGDGLQACLIFLSDGMPWFEDYIIPHFLVLVVILDAYHLLDRLSEYAALMYGKDSSMAKKWYADASKIVLGEKPAKAAKQRTRRGHEREKEQGPRGTERQLKAVPKTVSEQGDLSKQLQDLVMKVAIKPEDKERIEARDKMCAYIKKNGYRIDYSIYRHHWLQIGSGVMEAMHLTGAQVRLKVAGARWMEKTSQAVFSWRMLKLVGKWEDFWSQPKIAKRIADGIAKPLYKMRDDTVQSLKPTVLQEA